MISPGGHLTGDAPGEATFHTRITEPVLRPPARIRVTQGTVIGPDRARLAAGIITSLLTGLLIGRLDSGAGWDDTGVTAALLVVAAGIASFIAGQRPWLFAVTTGMFVPLFEPPGLAGGGALAAFLFSSIGAIGGWFASRRR